MGSKEKLWLTIPQSSPSGKFEPQWLLKRARPGTGEHWAEKIAFEVGRLLGLPIAFVQLATWDEDPATISKGFKGPGQSLVHGNELLSWVDPSYPKVGGDYRTKQHTLSAIKEALDAHNVSVDPRFQEAGLNAFGMFVGYLLLDALVCNTDRHHENWAVIATGSGDARSFVLAPTYDHASSLGRELQDAKRALKLNTTDRRGDLQAYCDKAVSALFVKEGDHKPLSCSGAYFAACDLDPGAAEYWQEVVRRVDPGSFPEILERVPSTLMSPEAREFSTRLLTNRLSFLQNTNR